MSIKTSEITDLFNRFEAAASEYEGIECWSARELQPLLGYSKWENFHKVIENAKEAAKSAGEDVLANFPEVRKTVQTGIGAAKEIDDILLTRYACYLIAQNRIGAMVELIDLQSESAARSLRLRRAAKRRIPPQATS